MPDFVKTTLKNHVLDVVIDHPPVNALSEQTYAELSAVFAGEATSDDVTVVILRGAGKGFTPGADIKDILKETQEDRVRKYDIVDTMIENLDAIPVPVLAQIHGFCLAAGMKLSAHCDIRLSSDTAIFGMPEVDRGLVGGSGAWLRRLGMPVGLVRELIYTGRRYSALDMHRAGFVDRVVPLAELNATVQSLAADLAGKDRSVLTKIKTMAKLEMTFLSEVEANRAVHEFSLRTPLDPEGINAFLGTKK